MGSNVNKKLIDEACVQVRDIFQKLVERAEESTRGEMYAHLNKAIGGAQKATAAPVKRRPGRPRKNPEASASSDKPKKAKAKRVVSDETRKKLAENLAKARAARAQKAKPATAKKRGPGRPRKVDVEAQASAEA